METPGDRLRIARINAGYSSASAAARALGMPVATYTQYENGTRNIQLDDAPKFARKFHTTENWLLYASGPTPSGSPLPTEEELATMLESAQREIPTSASIGDWPRYVAAGLRARLERFLEAGQTSPDPELAPEIARGKASRSRAPTKPGARG